MDLKNILKEVTEIMDRIEVIINKLERNYPLIPTNIVAFKKAEFLEKETKELKQKVKSLSIENSQLVESISCMMNELDSIIIPTKKSFESTQTHPQITSTNNNDLNINHNNSNCGLFNTKLTNKIDCTEN